MNQRESYEELLDVLQEQEAGLDALVVIAERQQEALVDSNYEAIERTAREMAEATVIVGELDLKRADLLSGLGREDASMADLVDEAASAGVTGFAETRDGLDRSMAALRAVQELNAHVIISASKLVERWAAALSGLIGSTYGSEGKAEMGETRSFLSRQA